MLQFSDFTPQQQRTLDRASFYAVVFDGMRGPERTTRRLRELGLMEILEGKRVPSRSAHGRTRTTMNLTEAGRELVRAYRRSKRD